MDVRKGEQMRLIDADALRRRVQKVAMEAWKMNLTSKIETTLKQFIDFIDEAPSAEPERKIGKWICVKTETSSGMKTQLKCSNCGASMFKLGQRFCSECGLKMEEQK